MIELKRDTRKARACANAGAKRSVAARRSKVTLFRLFSAASFAIIFVLAGCGGGTTAIVNPSSNGTFSISPGTATIDTNCVGCNAQNSSGGTVEQFTATMNSGGGAAAVTWSASAGGDANSGRGTITSSGQYTPPSYLTANSVQVTVTAALTSNPSVKASTTVTITPGFLQPLTPENAALGANGTLTVTGYIAEAGGSTGITFAVSNKATGSTGGQGSVSAANCVRSSTTFTHCTATYTAPASLTTGTTFVVGTIGTSPSTAATQVLLNTAGVSSNPAIHETQQTTPVVLGASGGNNKDYDQSNGQITDCCGGTLGSMIKNSSGSQYILSNNHVLARSDQATVGETVVQPGLIDDNCDPFGNNGAAISAVGVLDSVLPLKSATTNADAAIAKVNSNAVNSTGAILELGSLQSGTGLLAAAPPGISSSNGAGENAQLNMSVAKSGRTTGLTCATVSAVSLSVNVDYYTDCAETSHYLTKTYTNQIAISGNQFSDAGDSGSLVVDSSNAEPVGLFFAGGVDSSGVSLGVANPAPDVLNELGALNNTTYTFVGTSDHAVYCLNYGNSTVTAAQGVAITPAEASRAEQAMNQARMLVSSSTGILGVGTGKSSDHAGEAAVILYVDQNMNVNAPATVNGVRTVVVPTTQSAVSFGVAPQTPQEAAVPLTLNGPVLNGAIAAKNGIAKTLMQQNPAFFGVGVGQSLDNPQEASLVIMVDRRNIPAQLPATINGMRTRYVIMDRLHVTRSYATPVESRSKCSLHAAPRQARVRDLGLKF